MSNLKHTFIAMRPRQWIKNLLVFAALLFSRELFHVEHITETLLAFAAFCLSASAIYLINDVRDKEEDVHHPVKKNRPIAAGKVSVSEAYSVAVILLLVSFGGSYLLLPLNFLLILGGYLTMNILYSAGLKKVVIIDLLIVSIGFVLRAIAGAVAISVSISPWLLGTTFFVALFLILGKRRHELITLGADGANHRSVLDEYSKEMLDALLIIVTTSTIMMYVLYTLAERTIEIFGTANLVYTVVFVVYGIFRAFYLIYQKQQGGAPTEMLLSDRPLQINILLWIVTVSSIIYSGAAT